MVVHFDWTIFAAHFTFVSESVTMYFLKVVYDYGPFERDCSVV